MADRNTSRDARSLGDFELHRDAEGLGPASAALADQRSSGSISEGLSLGRLEYGAIQGFEKPFDSFFRLGWRYAQMPGPTNPKRENKMNESNTITVPALSGGTITYSKPASLLPSDATERKQVPLAAGVFDYFPSALIAVAKVSLAGNRQHNGEGAPLHWARGKSADHGDTMLRHFAERGTYDSDGLRHSAKMAWRALAILQLELEADGAPIARGAK
jgi:hypothetical protein